MKRLWMWCTALLLIAASAARAEGDKERPPGDKDQASQEGSAEHEEEEKDKKKEEEEKDRYLAVVGGDVYTVTQGVWRGATVLTKNGKIQRMGYDVTVPPEAAVLDASGLRVYPGLIACNSQGLVGADPSQDSTDVFSLTLLLGLASGITTVYSGNSATKLTYGTLDGILLKKDVFVSINLRSAADLHKFREDLDKIREHHRKLADYQKRKDAGEEIEEPKPEGLNKSYQDLLEGRGIARFNASSAGELRTIAALSRDYGFRAVVFGAEEGWIVAADLGRAHVTCVLSPRTTRDIDRRRNQQNGPRIENASMLHAGGVPVAVVPRRAGISLSGLVGADLLTLPVEADFAVRGGLSRDAALASITIEAARALGVDDFVGSLEAGKDADLIVTDGDVLHYKTLVHYAVVNGRLAYDKSKESLLSHIRPLEGEPRYKEAEILEDLEQIHPAQPEKTEEGAGPPAQEEGDHPDPEPEGDGS